MIDTIDLIRAMRVILAMRVIPAIRVIRAMPVAMSRPLKWVCFSCNNGHSSCFRMFVWHRHPKHKSGHDDETTMNKEEASTHKQHANEGPDPRVMRTLCYHHVYSYGDRIVLLLLSRRVDRSTHTMISIWWQHWSFLPLLADISTSRWEFEPILTHSIPFHFILFSLCLFNVPAQFTF